MSITAANAWADGGGGYNDGFGSGWAWDKEDGGDEEEGCEVRFAFDQAALRGSAHGCSYFADVPLGIWRVDVDGEGDCGGRRIQEVMTGPLTLHTSKCGLSVVSMRLLAPLCDAAGAIWFEEAPTAAAEATA